MNVQQIILLILLLLSLLVIIFTLILNKLYRTFFIIDRMSGKSFEKFITKLYIKLGYKAITTKTSGDQGIDVIIQKRFLKIGIQTKRYNKPVGNKAVQEATAGKKYYRLNKIAVITNNYFTKSAKELAYANDVELIDRDKLKELIEKAYKK